MITDLICIIGKVTRFTSHEFLAMFLNFIMSSVPSMKTLNRTFIMFVSTKRHLSNDVNTIWVKSTTLQYATFKPDI